MISGKCPDFRGKVSLFRSQNRVGRLARKGQSARIEKGDPVFLLQIGGMGMSIENETRTFRPCGRRKAFEHRFMFDVIQMSVRGKTDIPPTVQAMELLSAERGSQLPRTA